MPISAFSVEIKVAILCTLFLSIQLSMHVYLSNVYAIASLMQIGTTYLLNIPCTR